VNIFYQGSKVQLPNKNTTEVNLVAIQIQWVEWMSFRRTNTSK
jgi:hypothetical protein